MARIPYVDPEELPEEKRELLDTLSEQDGETEERAHSLEGGTLNVYRALGNNVELLEAFREFGGAAWRGGELTPHERETIILTVARETDSAYEFHQHVRVALDEGLAPETIRAISANDHEALDDETALLVDYVRAYVNGAVDDELHERLAAAYDEATIVAIGMLAGAYLGLARQLDAYAIETEVEFVGWQLENL